jgi:flagellar hook-associated protein 1 FlgK
MSLSSILSTAVSGLQTAQTGISTVSNNVANLNTPGYQREVINQTPLVVGGAGDGVTAGEIQTVTNQYLQSASLQASADAGSASIISSLLDQAQSAFGDPTSASSYLNQLSTVFSDFAAAANNPASALSRTQTLSDLNTFLSTTRQVAGTLSGLQTQAQEKIVTDITQVNQLLSQINQLNTAIANAKVTGADASGAENSQNGLLTTLSSLMDVTLTTQANGATLVRSNNGALLAGYGQSATLSYTQSPTGQGGAISIALGSGGSTPLDVGSGELQGLMSLSTTQIPAIQSELSQYVSGAVSAINAAHNANTTVPPPQTLIGRNTGLDLATIVGDFSGTTNIAVVDASGHLQQQVAIDFTADTMSVNGGPASGFVPATFLASLNAALGGTASASFSNGALSLSATAAGSGIATTDDPTTPSSDGGQGFSQFFGLNDLITSSQIVNYNTGLKTTDANGFAPGGTLTLQVNGPNGMPTTTIAIPTPVGPTMKDVVDALNTPVSGVGLYGSFSLGPNGAMTFTPASPGSASISVVSDTTQWGAGGASMSQLFGIGQAAGASRVGSYRIRPDIQASPANLALGQLNLAAAAGGYPVVAPGDNAGAIALSQAGQATTNFAAAGGLAAVATTVTQYAALLGGDLGQRATTANNANTAAQAVQTEATTRLQSATGVNLDQELVNLTTYQHAYSASAQLIQATQQMFNSLLNMVG